MNYSLTTVNGCTGDADNRRYQTLGAVCQLAAQSRAHAGLPLQQMIERLRMPIELDQVKVFFNDFGQCIGYATWAYLCPDVERRLLRGEALSLYDFEWNEGNRLWMIDLLVPLGSIQHVMIEMRDTLFRGSETVTYFRYKNGKRLCKQLSRSDCSHFWNNRKLAVA